MACNGEPCAQTRCSVARNAAKCGLRKSILDPTSQAWAIAKAQPTSWGLGWGRPTPVSMEIPSSQPLHVSSSPSPTADGIHDVWQLGGIARFRIKKPLPSPVPLLNCLRTVEFRLNRGIPSPPFPPDQLESQSHVIMSAGRCHAGEPWPCSRPMTPRVDAGCSRCASDIAGCAAA